MNSIRRILALCATAVFVTVLVAGFRQSAQADTRREVDVSGHAAEVRQTVETFAHQQHVPGVAAAVVDLATGERTQVTTGVDGDGRPITDVTQFLSGSVAKSMTATVVLELAADGRLSLDDPVTRHLATAPAGITVRDLLQHTAGYSFADGLAVADRGEAAYRSIGEAFAALPHTGTVGRYEYSTAGYLVLGAVVEAVTGRPYAEVLAARVLDPVGMTGSSALSSEVTDLPAGHRLWWGRPVRHSATFDSSAAPYSSVAVTLADLTRYAEAQLGAGDVIPAEVREQAQTGHVATSFDEYGYGWRVMTKDGEKVVHHTGAVPGYFAHVWLVPGSRLAVVVLANSFSEAHAESYAALAQNLHRVVTGRAPLEVGGDSLLSAVTPVLTGLALLGVVAVVAAWVRPVVRWRRRVLAGGSLALAAALVVLPGLLGHDFTAMRVWMPDAAVALGCGVAMWVLAAVVLVVRTPAKRARLAPSVP